ncbi:sugar transferase [Geojedonia litorea]|uniref:Sugar transferase n=1 Tax=Geojedonia litorea TaxID=1268269 RepID=A0ABV9MYW0_9FLAO
MITSQQLLYKRLFDFSFSLILLLFLFIPLLLLVLFASVDTQQWGLFKQVRVGQHARLFHIYKIRTLRQAKKGQGLGAEIISPFGQFLRAHRWDELPQLFNIVFGQMSFVGPRPDLPGFADMLEGEDRVLLKVKPGLTGPASLKYAQEAQVLAQQSDPEAYNRRVIWPDKVEINKNYVQSYRFSLDLTFIYRSLSRLI